MQHLSRTVSPALPHPCLRALRAAFPQTIPVLAGYFVLGLGYGIYVQSLGLPVWMPMLMGTVVYGGSLEFVLASLLLGAFSPLSAFLMALMIQARHLFYGLAMLERYKGYGWRSFYMIFAMSDETFSITCSATPPEGVDKGWFMFFITLLDQLYWVGSAGLGAALGTVLPFSTEGVDFVMTAMFTVIFLNQWEKDQQHGSALIGLAVPLVCLMVFGSGSFLLPSMGGILVLLLIGWSVYQYVMVRQLKQIRRQLTDANEEITRQSRRAMESEKMKTAFINSMCHEIRTPLNAINGFSDLLLEGDHDHDTRREFREQIWASTTALTTLLENMLELSRLVSSEEPLPLAETDLGLLCAERLQIQRELSQNPSVEYVLKGGGRGTCVIPTNETYMTRVIDNLLQNAAKFTAAGSVTVCCDKDDRTRKLRIRVTDTGIGIAPDKQEWVFDRFTKVDSFKPGSGIGLYLCRLIVTRLGGAIRVCPDYRAGCCIEITLPY